MDKARPPIPNLYWPFALDWLASFRAISPLLVVTGTGVWETGSQCGPVLLPPFSCFGWRTQVPRGGPCGLANERPVLL